MRRGKDTADHEKGGKKRRRASEKQNMLCTEDESMIKNVSRGAGRGRRRGRGRDHMVLKGNRGGINRLEQSLMVGYGKLISKGRGRGGREEMGIIGILQKFNGRDLVNFILSPYHFKVLKHFSVIEQLEIGQSREGVFNTWSA